MMSQEDQIQKFLKIKQTGLSLISEEENLIIIPLKTKKLTDVIPIQIFLMQPAALSGKSIIRRFYQLLIVLKNTMKKSMSDWKIH